MAAGVYRIRNIETQKTYIGSSVNVENRLNHHRGRLVANAHINKRLQSEWNRFGDACFAFEELINCPEVDLRVSEQNFLDAYFKHDMQIYNVHRSSNSQAGFRFHHTKESLEKLRKANIGKVLPAHVRKKIAIARTGVSLGPQSLEHKMKRVAAQIGRELSEETKNKIRASRIGKKGHPVSDTTREKLRVSALGNKRCQGRIVSEETRRRMSESIKAALKTRVRKASFQGRKHSLETRAKLSAIARARKLKLDGLGCYQPTTVAPVEV